MLIACVFVVNIRLDMHCCTLEWLKESLTDIDQLLVLSIEELWTAVC